MKMNRPLWSTTTVLLKQYIDFRPLYHSRCCCARVSAYGRGISIRVPSMKPMHPSNSGSVNARARRSISLGHLSSSFNASFKQLETKTASSQADDLDQFQP